MSDKPDETDEPVEETRGAALECGKCRVQFSWDPIREEYTCPECGYTK